MFLSLVDKSIANSLSFACAQGLSSTWWTTKHNVHHATPNHVNREAKDGRLHAIDPDIDTMPYLAWTPDMLIGASRTVRKIVTYQQYYFFAVLPLARFIWVEQAFEHVLKKYQVITLKKLDTFSRYLRIFFP